MHPCCSCGDDSLEPNPGTALSPAPSHPLSWRRDGAKPSLAPRPCGTSSWPAPSSVCVLSRLSVCAASSPGTGERSDLTLSTFSPGSSTRWASTRAQSESGFPKCRHTRQRVRPRTRATSPPLPGHFAPTSQPLRLPAPEAAASGNGSGHFSSLEAAREAAILALVRQATPVSEIVKQVYGVKGGEAFKRASQEVMAVISRALPAAEDD